MCLQGVTRVCTSPKSLLPGLTPAVSEPGWSLGPPLTPCPPRGLGSRLYWMLQPLFPEERLAAPKQSARKKIQVSPLEIWGGGLGERRRGMKSSPLLKQGGEGCCLWSSRLCRAGDGGVNPLHPTPRGAAGVGWHNCRDAGRSPPGDRDKGTGGGIAVLQHKPAELSGQKPGFYYHALE